MPSAETPVRPPVETVRSEDELRRWYWLRSELVQLARALGVSTAGAKLELTDRLADALAGRRPTAPVGRSARRPAPPLPDMLDGTTVLPPGQRCTQQLRAHLAAVVGPGFRFDGPMRAFIAAGGVTIDEVVAHWHATRDREPGEIAPQFEYNRFTRKWREDHPDGDREALLAAWWAHRDAPRSSAAQRPGPAPGQR